MDDLLLSGARRVGVEEPASLLVRDGVVAALGAEADSEAAADASRVSLDGLLLAPGFIDLQVNGARGRDFTTDPAAIWDVGDELLADGVTAFVPTIVSSSPDAVRAALDAWASGRSATGAVPLGLHLEGPFLAQERRGAHDGAQLREPDPDEAEGWSAEAGVRMVTLAPELPGALELIGELVERGVVVSLGHSDADAATARAGIDAGARYATHTFNAMSGLHHRRPGLAGGVLLDERVTVGLIADGHHLAPETLLLAWRLAGPGRISLVTDAIAALGMPPGQYPLAGKTVEFDGSSARLPNGTLAGSVARLDDCVRNFAAATGCGLPAALDAVTSVPARLLGLDDGRGTLRVGGRADIAVLTEAGEVAATLVGGAVAHATEPDRWA